METYQHNQVKLCIGAALSDIGRRENLGLYFIDGFRLSLEGGTRFFLPDGCFIKYRSLGLRRRGDGELGRGSEGEKGRAGEGAISGSPARRLAPSFPAKVAFTHGKRLVYTGLSGVPDLLVEVGSMSRLEADYVVKAREYAQLGVPEFWLLMPDGPSYRLLILRRDRKTAAYAPVVWRPNAWVYSPTFRRRFRLLCLPSIDARLPAYELRSRESGIRGQESGVRDESWRVARSESSTGVKDLTRGSATPFTDSGHATQGKKGESSVSRNAPHAPQGQNPGAMRA